MGNKVYVFHGEGGQFCSAVFDELLTAKKWISKNKLTGVLTAYPLNQSAYDWAIEQAYFTPNKSYQHSPKFIGRFTSASQEHYHFENGEQP